MNLNTDEHFRNNQLQNQAQRNLQAAGSTPLSASPAHLSITSGILPPAYNTHNPYHTSPYSAGPSPFAFPQQPSLQHQNPYQHQQLRHDSITQAQQHQIPPSPSVGRKRRESDIDTSQISGASGLGGYSVDQHGMFSPGAKANHDQSGYSIAGPSQPGGNVGDVMSQTADMTASRPAKKGRTNTPWTPAEEQRLKVMRDAGNSWSEIAKTFPTRTEGSVKKHWYKVGQFYRLPHFNCNVAYRCLY